MFYSLTFPAILQVHAVRANPVNTHLGERVPASMTVEKPVDPQGSDFASRDAGLTLTMLYEQFKRPIHSYVYRLLGNQEDADDITQEVFVRACTSWSGLYERDRLSPWLYRIATNLCVDQLRRRKRISWWPLSLRSHKDGFDEDAGNDDTSSLLADSGGIPEIAEREHIRLTLMSMPEEYAVALVLSAAQGIPYQEIAAILAISPNAAATRISRAKRMFAEKYEHISKEGTGKQEKAR
jgi:RNA polymerase sigma-70 factor (ECF subfamily)